MKLPVLAILLLLPLGIRAQVPRARISGDLKPEQVRRIADPTASKFGDPQMFQMWNSGIVLYDASDTRLLGLDFNGALKWRAGRAGAGPGEFRSITSMFSDARGNTYVLDPANARYSVWSPTGKLAREIKLSEGLQEMVATPSGDVIASARKEGAELLIVFDSSGRRKHVMRAPSGLDTLGFMSKEHQLIRLTNGKTLIIFYWSSRFVAFNDDGSLWFDSMGIDSVPFPLVVSRRVSSNSVASYVDPKAKEVTSSACDDGKEILVLSAFIVDDRRNLDRYRMRDGRYVGSTQLPGATSFIACNAQRFLALENADEPVIVEYRMRRR